MEIQNKISINLFITYQITEEPIHESSLSRRTQQMNKKKLITMVLANEGEFTKPLTRTGTHKIVSEVKGVTQLNALFYT